MPDSDRLATWGIPVAFVVVVSAVLLAVFPLGFTNYDTIYYLLWGREIFDGMSPDYAPALTPTPHPLYDLLGFVAAPLGDGAITVAVVIAYFSLGLLVFLVYRLGSIWFDRPIGLLAALFVITAAPVLSTGLRAYIDIPFLVLCLWALLVETRRPRAGWPVLALLIPAGLLRPEAWLFSGAYFLYLMVDVKRIPGRRLPGLEFRPEGIGRRVVGLAILAAAAPLLWFLFDLITAGNPLESFTGTRDNVETLERNTGPVDVVLYGPRSLGEVLQWPGMIGALLGVLLTLKVMPKRAAVPLAGAVLALGAFAVLGAAGLAIIPRYTMLGASILAVFSAATILGWRLVPADSRWRRPWQAAALLVVLLYLVWLPNQIDLLETVDRDLANQSLVENDLEALVDDGAFEPLTDPDCLPISVPNHRATPRLAFWLDIRPSRVVSIAAAEKQPEAGYFLAPARPFTLHNFILDPGQPGRAVTRPPPGFRPVAENRSWKLYRRCPVPYRG
ncbi:MAG: hypothetical protein JJE10_07135 [Thermoleophilia bacterium]|nr:hypothetical protein [Thermoleophilia bacterium]